MKLAIIIGVLAISLVLAHADEEANAVQSDSVQTDAVSLDQLEGSISTLKEHEKSLTEKLERLLEELKRKLEEILQSPRRAVEERAEEIKESAQEMQNCIEDQTNRIPRVVQNLNSNIKRCIKIALGKGTIVGGKIGRLVKEVAEKIREIVENVTDCKNKPNIILIQICLFNESCRAKQIIEKTVEDIKAVIESGEGKIPQIIKDLIRCIERAESEARSELDDIDNNISKRCGDCRDEENVVL